MSPQFLCFVKVFARPTLGAAFWIPALFVPPLLVSHGYIFWQLVRESGQRRAVRAETHPAS
jgi:hypothetical protein